MVVDNLFVKFARKHLVLHHPILNRGCFIVHIAGMFFRKEKSQTFQYPQMRNKQCPFCIDPLKKLSSVEFLEYLNDKQEFKLHYIYRYHEFTTYYLGLFFHQFLKVV